MRPVFARDAEAFTSWRMRVRHTAEAKSKALVIKVAISGMRETRVVVIGTGTLGWLVSELADTTKSSMKSMPDAIVYNHRKKTTSVTKRHIKATTLLKNWQDARCAETRFLCLAFGPVAFGFCPLDKNVSPGKKP